MSLQRKPPARYPVPSFSWLRLPGANSKRISQLYVPSGVLHQDATSVRPPVLGRSDSGRLNKSLPQFFDAFAPFGVCLGGLVVAPILSASKENAEFSASAPSGRFRFTRIPAIGPSSPAASTSLSADISAGWSSTKLADSPSSAYTAADAQPYRGPATTRSIAAWHSAWS